MPKTLYDIMIILEKLPENCSQNLQNKPTGYIFTLFIEKFKYWYSVVYEKKLPEYSEKELYINDLEEIKKFKNNFVHLANFLNFWQENIISLKNDIMMIKKSEQALSKTPTILT